jgi:Bacterial extracellular solute-binding proteins, family 3
MVTRRSPALNVEPAVYVQRVLERLPRTADPSPPPPRHSRYIAQVCESAGQSSGAAASITPFPPRGADVPSTLRIHDALRRNNGPRFLMRCALLSQIAVLLACPGKAADPVLAPSGTLRAAYIGPKVALARLDPATGTISGVIADIARELGRRADVPVSITPLPTAAAVVDAVRSGQVDIGFVAPNPERTGVVLYSQTYMLVQQSALVRS